jgi:squalene cyclase
LLQVGHACILRIRMLALICNISVPHIDIFRHVLRSALAAGHRVEEVSRSLQVGRDYILSIQRPDGSWYGSWGVCFTYGIWFGVEALAAAPPCAESKAVRL